MALESEHRPPWRWMTILQYAFATSISLCFAFAAAGFLESRLRAQERVQQYLVKLRDAPVILHLHSQPSASKLRSALRHDRQAPAATQYRSRLHAKQATLQQLIEQLPGATVQTQMDTVFNGIAVTLRPQNVPAVRRYAGIEEVIPSISYHQALEQIASLPGNGPPLESTVGPAPLRDVASVALSDKPCSQLPLDSLTGVLVLISRGNCNFSEKILNAYLAGTIGVVIYNNQLNQPPIAMDVQNITQIPAVMIGNVDGLNLKQFVGAAGPGVTATLGAVQEAIPATPNQMSNFPSNGPSTDFGSKPDMVAPGTDLYSATQRSGQQSGHGCHWRISSLCCPRTAGMQRTMCKRPVRTSGTGHCLTPLGGSR